MMGDVLEIYKMVKRYRKRVLAVNCATSNLDEGCASTMGFFPHSWRGLFIGKYVVYACSDIEDRLNVVLIRT